MIAGGGFKAMRGNINSSARTARQEKQRRPDNFLEAGPVSALKIEYLPSGSLKPSAHNPHTHSPRQIRQIAESIRKFGFTNPILLDSNGYVLAGHGRLEAATSLGIERVPTIRLDQMTEAEKRAYVLADNKLAENAGWDRELLAIELKYLVELDFDFDVTVTGFETPEIDLLLQGDSNAADSEEDQIPELEPPVSRLGDLWILGKHRLLCADATKAESFELLMGGQPAQLVFIDPPYNVRIDGNVSGLGSIKHREFAMASGEMSEAEFINFLKTVFSHLVAHSANGSIHFVCMDWRHTFELLSAGRVSYAELKNLCVWNKKNGGMGSLYRSKHELVFVFKNGAAPHINNIELGRHGRWRSNVWDYAGVNSMRKGRLEELAMHPTVKPIAMVADAILDCSKRRGIVLDCFGGSGTTLMAAEKTGRHGYLVELDPTYVDVTIRRYQKLTGKSAVDAKSHRKFDEVQR
jgi:DNA modification methylase